jgi:hypothetical protein
MSDPMTWIASNLYPVPWAVLRSRGLPVLKTGTQPIAAAEAGDTVSHQEAAVPGPNPRRNLHAVLSGNEKGKLPLADGAQLSAPAIRRQFLDELLCDCGFFAHRVFIRTVRNLSNRLVTIIQFVISDPMTWIGSNLYELLWAALCSKVLSLPKTETQPLAAAGAADIVGCQEAAASRTKSRWNLHAVLSGNENGTLPLADGAQLGAPAIRRQFLGELLRDCSFFAHLVFRQVRTVRNSSSRLADRDSPRTKFNVVKNSPVSPRSSSSGEASSLQSGVSVSFLPSLWVEVGYRHVQTHVSGKECHEYREDSKPAL